MFGPRDVKVHLFDRLRVCLRWKTGPAWIRTCGPRDYEKSGPTKIGVFLQVFAPATLCASKCVSAFMGAAHKNRHASEHSSDAYDCFNSAAHGALEAAKLVLLDFVDYGVSRAQRAGRCTQ